MRQPLILFVEDVQFIDEDSLNFLPRLKLSLAASDELYPIAILATSRFESHSRVLEGDLVDRQLTLRGLSREAVARLVEILLGGVPSLSLVNLVMDRSEGNPYFVEQIIRYLQEENLIEMSADGWKQVKRVRESFLPGDIGALLVARLDQLSRKVKELVQTASILGREFLLHILSEMTAEGDALEQYVNEGERSAIWTGDREGRYIFTHGLLRDVAYTMQMRARRQELHALAVMALERIYAEDLRFHYVELAYHSERAEIREKTQLYYILAGKVASDSFQNAKGIEYLTRALAYTPFSDVATQFDLLVERVELFKRTGDHQSHGKDLETLERLAQELDDPQREAVVEMLLAHYFVVRGDYPAVIRHAERVIALSRTFTRAEIVLKTYQVWPLALLRMGKLDEAMKIAKEGRQLAQQYGDLVKEGYILVSMGLIAVEQRDPSFAHKYFQNVWTIAQEAKDKRLESRALGNLGYSAGFILQDYALARQYYEMAYDLSHQLGERIQESTALSNIGWTAGMQGDFDAALSFYARALSVAREIGNSYLETNTLINLSSVSGVVGDFQLSLEYSQKSLALSRTTGDRSNEAWSLLYMGYAYLLQLDLQQAKEAFSKSILIRQEMGQPLLKTESQAGLIQTYLAMGNLDSALSEAETIIPYLQNGDALQGTEEPLRVYCACYLALERAQDPRSQAVLHSAVQLLETQVSKLKDQNARQMFVENVPWRLLIHQAWEEHTSTDART
jgi:tetratricopeptide (TPR) repeat protein